MHLVKEVYYAIKVIGDGDGDGDVGLIIRL